MCGIAGYITKAGVTESTDARAKKRKIIRGLIIANEARGNESAGIAVIGKGTKILKDTVTPTEFATSHKFKRALLEKHQIVLGHTRLATTGKVTKENAHPFTKGKITGVHNGMVSNYLSFNKKVEVDSEVMFELLNKNKDFSEAFKKLTGLFAVAWTDTRKPGSVFLVRDGNPLAVALVPSLNTYFFSSERLMLEGIISSHYNRFTAFTLKEEMVYKIKPDLSIEKTKVAFKAGGYSLYGYDDYGRSGLYYSNLGKKHKVGVNETKIATIEEDDFDWDAEKLVVWDSLTEEQKLQIYVRDMARDEGCEMCGMPLNKWAWYDSIEELVLCDHHRHMSPKAVRVSFKGVPKISFQDATHTPLNSQKAEMALG